MFLERLYQEARWLHIGTFSEAWDQGFEEGYDQGFEEGYKKGQEEPPDVTDPAFTNRFLKQIQLPAIQQIPVVFDYDDFLPNKLKRKP